MTLAANLTQIIGKIKYRMQIILVAKLLSGANSGFWVHS